MEHPNLPSGYIFILEGGSHAHRRIQLRNHAFDLLGQVTEDDPENLKNLFTGNGYSASASQLIAALPELPAGKFVSINYERGLQRKDPGI
ncbi:MAG: hypothetical protein AAGN35_20835 [Bacteroidota bacterium]